MWSEVSCVLCVPCSLPRSVPGGADAVGPFWKDRFAVQHHSTANHTHLQTEVQRDPCLSLWRGIHPSLISTTHFQYLWIIITSTIWGHRRGELCWSGFIPDTGVYDWSHNISSMRSCVKGSRDWYSGKSDRHLPDCPLPQLFRHSCGMSEKVQDQNVNVAACVSTESTSEAWKKRLPH